MLDRNKHHAQPERLWAGAEEAIFSALPGTILSNFYTPRSENALLWNLIYPRAHPSINLRALLTLKPLWGTTDLQMDEEEVLTPYFWGYHIDGTRLPGLEQVLVEIDGAGPRTEIDLFLSGASTLIAVEAKHTGGFGRCSRYMAAQCPEVHPATTGTAVCRYWELGPSRFADQLAMGDRPMLDQMVIPCNDHYQLARTYLVGKTLAQRLGRRFALWIFIPRKRWRSLQTGWLDFAERVQDDRVWRWMRVIPWEELQKLPTS